MNKMISFKEKYKEIIEKLEAFLVSGTMIGENVRLEIFENEIVYRTNDTNNITYLKLTIHDNLLKQFQISFQDSKFISSGYKGVFKEENIHYFLQRSGISVWYIIYLDKDKEIKQTLRLLKLFRKYL